MEPGAWVDGRYKILRLLGSGQEGKVYLAFQERTFRFYAIKELEKEGICFSREGMEVWKRLQAPGLPEIVDILEQENIILLIMEYIEGNNLAKWIRKNGEPTLGTACVWGIEICRTLEYLHGQKPPIIYGDLKPENLILQKNHLIMVDLGSAFLRGSKGKRTGTLKYCIPEGTSGGEEEDLYSFRIFAEKILGISLETLKKCRTISECRMALQKKRVTPGIRMGFLLAAMLILAGAGRMKADGLSRDVLQSQYEGQLKIAERVQGEERRQLLMQMIRGEPGREEGYLELLEEYQEDLVLSQEEDVCFRKLLKETVGKAGRSCEEMLRENLSGYARVAYEAGITYWYFYEGREGKSCGAAWFQKVCDLPGEAVGEERQQKSRLYAQLEVYRKKMELYEETGEGIWLFPSYWSHMEELAQGDLEEFKGELVRLLFWQEYAGAIAHYMVEFWQSGISRKQMEQILERMREELEQIQGNLQKIQEQKEELLLQEPMLREMMDRVYREETK